MALTRIRAACASAAAFFLAAPLNAAAPEIHSFTLDNGLRGVVIEDHRAPVVTHMVWYDVGSSDEPPGQTGIAHYLEHLMFMGSEKIPSGRFSEIVAENGGQGNAFTSRDYTAYFQTIAADRLGLMMELEADRMRNIVIAQDKIVSERAVVIEERNSRTDNNPSGKFREQMTAALFQNHPYGNPVIGWRHEIEELDRDDALAFYERFYAPNNAILVVAGDVTGEEVEALARTHYGPVEAVDLPAHSRPVEPPHRAERRLRMADPRVAQPSFSRYYLVPTYVTAPPGEAEALTLLADILGGGSTRRLGRTLGEGAEIAISVGAWYSGLTREDSEFGLYGTPSGDSTLAELEAAIDWVLNDLIENGITEDELARAKRATVAEEIYARDSLTSMARIYGSNLIVGQSLDDIHSWSEDIAAVTEDDIIAVARKYLVPERSVTGWLERADAAEATQ